MIDSQTIQDCVTNSNCSFEQLPDISTNAGKVDFFLDMLTSQSLLPKYVQDAKNNQKSVELRKQGNKLFGLHKDEEALQKYTQSIAFAANKSEELGLAYANRSAVLFKLKLFQDCLKDTENAFQNNYPDSLKPKLFDRKKRAKVFELKEKKSLHHQSIPIIPKENRNPFIECASNSVEIKSNTEFGRHVVATRDIKIGEVIVVEKAKFTKIDGQTWCHCHHCLTLCYCLIPCESCTNTLFCSTACKSEANNYHYYECPILATVDSLNFSDFVLSLRIAILMKNEYKSLYAEMLKPDHIYRSGRYREVHNFVTNIESRPKAMLFEWWKAVALLYHLMKRYTNFFKHSDNKCEDTFKNLVFHHISIQFNFHSIDELEKKIDHTYKLTKIGGGTYSFLTLLNHSCAPNVYSAGYGTTLVLRSIETIKKGEQLFYMYGTPPGIITKAERQEHLKLKYCFECECRACRNDWGALAALPYSTKSNCTQAINLIYLKLKGADLETAIIVENDITKIIQLLENEVPSRDFFFAQDLLMLCYDIGGNVRKAY